MMVGSKIVRRQHMGLLAGTVVILWAAVGTTADVQTIEGGAYRVEVPASWVSLSERETEAREQMARTINASKEGASLSALKLQVLGESSGSVQLLLLDTDMGHLRAHMALKTTREYLVKSALEFRVGMERSGNVFQEFSLNDEDEWVQVDYQAESQRRRIYGRAFFMMNMSGNARLIEALCSAQPEAADRCQSPIASFRATLDQRQLRPLDSRALGPYSRSYEAGRRLGELVGYVVPLAIAIYIVRYIIRRKPKATLSNTPLSNLALCTPHHQIEASLPTVFISYSRSDFNFAEAATATLNGDGKVRAWMDVQHLRPGTDWKTTIDETLDCANTFLLVASPAALNSSFVIDEWRRALTRGIPIHIAVVDAVELPAELAHCPVHDLRTQFWQRVVNIGHLIAEGRHDASAMLPRPNKLRLPTKLPFPLIALLSVLLFVSIIFLCMAHMEWGRYAVLDGNSSGFDILHLNRFRRAAVILCSSSLTVMGATLLIVATGLLRRRTSASTLINTLVLSAVVIFLCIVHFRFVGASVQPFIFSAITVTAIAFGGLIARSRTVHLWLPSGESFYSVRQRILGLPVVRRQIFRPDFDYQWETFSQRLAKLFQNKKISFDVRCDRADEPVANVIRRACESAGVSIGGDNPEWIFFIVSSLTDWNDLHAYFKRSTSSVIFVLADNLQLPPDADELRHHQWLDFREQLPEGLFNLLAGLGASLPDYDSSTLPLNTNRFRAPRVVHWLIEIWRLHIMLIVAPVLGALVLRPLQLGTLTLLGISVLLVACLTHLTVSTAMRRLTKCHFGILGGIACSLVGIWIVVGKSTYWHDQAIIVPKWWTMQVMIILIPFIVPLLRIYMNVSQYWLPTSTRTTVATAVYPPLFASHMVIMAILFVGLAVSSGFLTF